MPRKLSIILFFILAMVAGSLLFSFSVQDLFARQPYQIALSREFLNDRIIKLEGRIELLEAEVEKLKKELEEMRKSFTVIKQQQENPKKQPK